MSARANKSTSSLPDNSTRRQRQCHARKVATVGQREVVLFGAGAEPDARRGRVIRDGATRVGATAVDQCPPGRRRKKSGGLRHERDRPLQEMLRVEAITSVPEFFREDLPLTPKKAGPQLPHVGSERTVWASTRPVLSSRPSSCRCFRRASARKRRSSSTWPRRDISK